MGNPCSAPKHLTLELRPKASPERFLIAGLGAVAGYMLCGFILEMIDQTLDVSANAWTVQATSALMGLLTF